MKIKRSKHNKGFTLIEVLVSLVLVVLIVQKAMGAVSNHQKNALMATQRLQAYYLAVEAHDQLQSMYNLESKTPHSTHTTPTNWDTFMKDKTSSSTSDIYFTLDGSKDYQYASGSETSLLPLMNKTQFTRTVTVAKAAPTGVSSNHYRKLNIKVIWSDVHFKSTDTVISLDYYFYDPNQN